MKRIRIHSARYITPLNVQGPILSVIEVEDTVYESIIKAGHCVEVLEEKVKVPKINKTVLQTLEIKPKHNIIELSEEILEEVEVEEQPKLEEKEKESIKVLKTELTSERIVKRSHRNNRKRGK